MKNLILKWTISKARDTYGYNVVTLWDGSTKYKASGGGYDMQGTVFADWLWANHKEAIYRIIGPQKEKFYGYWEYNERPGIDGACGLDCIIRIAQAIGLEVQRDCNRKGHLTNIIIGGIT